MTTLEDVTKKRAEPSAEAAAAAELVRLAKEQGLSLTGPDGLLKQFTKTVLETALNEEMTEHLGHDKNQAPPDRESTNIRNGTRSKTVLTEATGHVPIEVPRDREGTFDPQIVKKRQRRLNGVDEIVLSLYAKVLTTGEISSHFAEIYGASVSKETISRITDKVLEEMQDWAARPLDAVSERDLLDALSAHGELLGSQVLRRTVEHMRTRNISDPADATLLSDGINVYECESSKEILDLIGRGRAVFGIATIGTTQEPISAIVDFQGGPDSSVITSKNKHASTNLAGEPQKIKALIQRN